MVYSAVIIVTLIGAVFGAPPVPSSQRIIGGSSTVIQEYPYMGSIQQQRPSGDTWSHTCGVSLIRPRAVLSAAHCFDDVDDPTMYRVRLGSSFQQSGGQLHRVAKITSHEDYDYDTYVNDIAVVKLATSVIFSNSVQMVRIPPPVYNIPDNTQVTTMGWGYMSYGDINFLPEQLQHVDVYTVNQTICAERYEYIASLLDVPIRVEDGMLCAGLLDVGGKDVCNGDSGGPIVLKTPEGHVLVGVVSFSYECAHPSYPGVYVRTSYYSDWIYEHADF